MAKVPAVTDMTLLAFLTTQCSPCQQFWDMLADPVARASLGVKVVVVTPSPSMEDLRRAQELAPAGTELHMSSKTWFDYGVTQAATFVLVHGTPQAGPFGQAASCGGVVGSGTPANPAELVELLAHWLPNGR